MTKLFEATDYITRPNEVTVDGLTAEMAGWLVVQPVFLQLRADARGHPAMYAFLRAVTEVGQQWRSSVRGTPLPNKPEQRQALRPWATTSEAATLLGIQPRGVLQAIKRGRLPADQVGGQWHIQREDLEHYRAARSPA